MNIRNIAQIEMHYRFTELDKQNLQQLQPIMEKNKEQLASKLGNILLELDETNKIMQDEETFHKWKEIFGSWFTNLFNGVYDEHYLRNIKNIASFHVKIGLDANYINSSIHMVREFCLEIIYDNFKDSQKSFALIRSMEKIMSINQDILSNIYRREEMSELSISNKLKSKLLSFAEQFNGALNGMLVVALLGISLGVIVLFFNDLWKLINSHLEHGIINIMGTLLILWVMIELVESEIEHLKKGKFSINIFVEVVMVAMIRDLLISTLEHGEIIKQALLLSAILVLGIVYALISWTESKKNNK